MTRKVSSFFCCYMTAYRTDKRPARKVKMTSMMKLPIQRAVVLRGIALSTLEPTIIIIANKNPIPIHT